MSTPTLPGIASDIAPDAQRITLPETPVIRPVPPERPAPPTPTAARWFWVSIVILAVLLVAAIAAIAWQQDRVSDANATLTTTRGELGTLQGDLTSAQAEVTLLDRRLARADTEVNGLEREVERLRGVLATTRGDSERIAAELLETKADLARAREDVVAARADVAAARAEYGAVRAELVAIAGSPLADGTWDGRIFMMGGTQSPPTIAFDERRLFTGRDAIQAMIEDGTPREKAQRCDRYCVYWRNPSAEWRIMTIDPNATVTLQSFRFQEHGGYHATEMSIAKFTRIFNGTAEWNAHLAHASYQLTMQGARVTAIDELNLSP